MLPPPPPAPRDPDDEQGTVLLRPGELPLVPPAPEAPTVADAVSAPAQAPPLADAAGAEACARAVAAWIAAQRARPGFAPHAELAFEPQGELGRGGMGVVLRVRDRRLGRPAALKLIRSGRDRPQAVARFRREVEVQARLDHPSIPPVYESGVTPGGDEYLLMRLIEGASLQARIRALHEAGPPSGTGERELLEALVRVGEAVAYAHAQGVVHRDLKPENVMVGRFGEVLVMDWGLALRRGEAEARPVSPGGGASASGSGAPPGAPDQPPPGDAGLTRDGAVVGTPGYMPPEQAAGGAVDARADVFALGALLTEVLTGRPPVEGPSAINRITATLQARIETPRRRRPDVPAELESLAAAALEPDPARRLSDATAFVTDLRAFLAGDELTTHRYRARERLVRAVRRRPALFVGLLVAALGLGLAGGVAAVLRQRALAAEHRQARADAERRQAEETRARIEGALSALGEARALAQVSGRADEVRARVAEALARAPARSAFLLWTAAEVYREAGLVPEAEAALEESIRLHPPALAEHLFLHRLAISRGTGEAASMSEPLRRLARLSDGGPDNGYALFVRGVAAHAEMRCGEAVALLDRALALEPDLPLGYQARGECRAHTGDLEGAVADLGRAVELEPRRPEPWLFRGEAREALGDRAGAAADRHRFLALAPDHPRAAEVRARLGE